MSLGPNVSMRFDELDKAALVELAARLRRSQTEVLRGLVRESLAILKEQDVKAESKVKRKSGNSKKIKNFI